MSKRCQQNGNCLFQNKSLKLQLINYHKFLKYSDTQKICCNHSNIWTMWLYHRVMSPKDADGMADSVGPDQRSSLIWVCTVCPGISVRKLRIIMVAPILTTLHQTSLDCGQIPTDWRDVWIVAVYKKDKTQTGQLPTCVPYIHHLCMSHDMRKSVYAIC